MPSGGGHVGPAPRSAPPNVHSGLVSDETKVSTSASARAIRRLGRTTDTVCGTDEKPMNLKMSLRLAIGSSFLFTIHVPKRRVEGWATRLVGVSWVVSPHCLQQSLGAHRLLKLESQLSSRVLEKFVGGEQGLQGCGLRRFALAGAPRGLPRAQKKGFGGSGESPRRAIQWVLFGCFDQGQLQLVERPASRRTLHR